MGLIAAILLSQAAVAPPPPQTAGQRVTAVARVEILWVGRSGQAEDNSAPHRSIRQEQGAAITVFE